MILEPKTVDDIKANREEWAAALESGQYRQITSGHLDDGRGGYCCLGVLKHCLMHGWPLFGDYGVPVTGLSNEQWEALASANDAGKTFPEIARMIRELPLPEEVSA